MIIVQGYICAAANKVELYANRIAAHVAFVQKLDGCLQYSIAADFADKGTLWVAERWTDQASQAAHTAGDHMAQFNAFMKHLHVTAVHLARYDVPGDGEWMMRIGPKR
jgi:quinol monooxygenase YgiN